MTHHSRVKQMAGLFFLFALLAVPAAAIPIASCNVNFVCGVPENVLMQFPVSFGFAISGDVVLRELNGVTVSDVFRIFNDIVDTGAGTGLGTTFFLYSADDSTPLPAPATYSANVVFITENQSSPVTVFRANGDTYLLGAPEPATFGLLGAGLALTAGISLKRRVLNKRPAIESAG